MHNHVLGNGDVSVSEACVEGDGVEKCEGKEVTNGFEMGFGFRVITIYSRCVDVNVGW